MIGGGFGWEAFDGFDEVGVDFQNALAEAVADFIPLVEGVAERLADVAGAALLFVRESRKNSGKTGYMRHHAIKVRFDEIARYEILSAPRGFQSFKDSVGVDRDDIIDSCGLS